MQDIAGLSCSPKEYRKVEEEIRSVYSNRGPYACANDPQEKEQKLEELKTLGIQSSYVNKLKEEREQIEALQEAFQAKDEQLLQKERTINKLTQDLNTYYNYKTDFDKLLVRAEKDRYELDRTRIERDDLREELKKIHKENLKEENLHLKKQIISLTAKQQALTNALEQAELTRERDLRQQDQVKKLNQEKFHELKLVIEGLKEQNGSLAKRLRDSEDVVAKQISLDQIKESQISQLLVSMQALKDLRNELQEKNNILNATVQDLQERMEHMSNQHAKEISDLDIKLNEFESSVRKLSKQLLDAKMKDKEALAREIQNDKEKENLTRIADQLRKEKIEVEARAEHLEKERQKLLDTVRNLNAKLNDHEHQSSKQQERKNSEKRIDFQVQRMRSQLKSSCKLQVDKIESIIQAINSRRKRN